MAKGEHAKLKRARKYIYTLSKPASLAVMGSPAPSDCVILSMTLAGAE
jgi:hypothetical protein